MGAKKLEGTRLDEKLKEISNIINKYMRLIKYQNNSNFHNFLSDTSLNINNFLSNSYAEYEDNKQSICEVKEEENEKSEYSDFLDFLRNSLGEMLNAEEMPLELRCLSHDIANALWYLLNPKTYNQNIKALQKRYQQNNSVKLLTRLY